ncbi:ParB/RepB/Spo0J family partition protein [Streptomyces sp. G-G2]|uniref:ParB/RepB/Spo0J family partition protein n=1 Tax=Streptomyces sp. G-G2 TaxID=3046201 RepID=UPI0024BADF37|nr:ParB/RepB/Spo0J family partition protein [Streptomyces sp. G-G2]MDJ0382895.1 ParB/RepB/Spo0J family partition protein [Streptomyces sp. G-G2]
MTVDTAAAPFRAITLPTLTALPAALTALRPVTLPAPAAVLQTGCVPVHALLDAESPRLAGVDQDHVRLLAALETELPPIVVHRATLRVVDGMHRLHAARLRGRESIAVRWFDGTEREAFLLAVETNNRHGLPLTLSDRRESARRILRAWPDWSDRAVAAKVGLSGKTVGVLRRTAAEQGETGAPGELPAARVGCDGRARPLNATEGRLRAMDYLAVRPEASLREIARSAGISVETARDVRDRLGRGEGPLPGSGTGLRTGVRVPAPDAEGAAPRPGRAADRAAVDLPLVLDSLKRDPTLKYSDEGRAMIRWLEARMIREGESGVVLRAPDHQAPKIAAMARACAAHWDEIATELEHRGAGASAGAHRTGPDHR